MTTELVDRPTETPKPSPAEPPRFGTMLALWIALTILFAGALWVSGLRGNRLLSAIEQGAAEAEKAGIGEVPEDVVRKAIRTQQDTLPFWSAVQAMGDFLFEPIGLALRALVVATLFSSMAALVGRPVRFPEAMASCVASQGWWVLGMAFRASLMIALRRDDVDTSATLLLPPGTHPAPLWFALRQVDVFAALGWASMAWGGWRRSQVNLFTAVAICTLLWLAEAGFRIAVALIVGAGMRLTLVNG